MKKYMILAAGIMLLLVLSGIIFYNVVTQREAPDFKEGILVPEGISINDIEIIDKVVAKTLFMEIQKSPLEKATKRDMDSIKDRDRAFEIEALYNEEASKSGRLTLIEVMQDGTFVAAKNVNGRLQYAKGKLNTYTMDFLTGLYTLQ